MAKVRIAQNLAKVGQIQVEKCDQIDDKRLIFNKKSLLKLVLTVTLHYKWWEHVKSYVCMYAYDVECGNMEFGVSWVKSQIFTEIRK